MKMTSRNEWGAARNWSWIAVFAALLIPFFLPSGFISAVVPAASAAVFPLQVVSFVVTLYLGAVRKRLDVFSGIALAVVAVMFLSTFLNEGFGRLWIYKQCFFDWAPLAVAALLVGYARQQRMTEFLVALLVVTGVLSLCNTASVLVFPDGLYRGGREPINFFGHKNASIDIVLPSVLCSLLLDQKKRKLISVRSIALVILGIVQFVVTYSATSVLAFAFFLALFFLLQIKTIRSCVNGISLLGGYVAALVLLMGVKIQELFAPILVGVLGKTVTFTLRTYVWEGVFSMMTLDHLLLGYGASVRFALFFNDFLYNNAHNLFLHVLVSGGLVGLVLYGALVVLASMSLFKGRFGAGSCALVAAFGCFLVVGLMESLIGIAWPLVLALGFYCNESALLGEVQERGR